MNNKELGQIAKQQINHNKSSVFQQKSNIKIDNIDYKLAMYFFYFLEGRIDQLPNYEFLDKTINGKKGIISTGYGLIVSNVEDIFIEYEEPIRENISRFERITYNSHTSCIVNTKTGITQKINKEEIPLFDENRIRYIQEYLFKYIKHEKENSTNNKHK